MSEKRVTLVVRKDRKGKHYWHSDQEWWVPHDNLELTSHTFREGTTIFMEEPDAKKLNKTAATTDRN